MNVSGHLGVVWIEIFERCLEGLMMFRILTTLGNLTTLRRLRKKKCWERGRRIYR